MSVCLKEYLSSSNNFTTVSNDDVLRWPVHAISRLVLNVGDDVQALDDLTENNVTSIEPLSLHRADEKLASVRVGTGIRHTQDSWSGVGQFEVLVGELVAVDTLAAGAIARGEITTLDHEVLDNTVKLNP